MNSKNTERGQIAILIMLVIGGVLASLVYFGISRNTMFRRQVAILDGSQVANDVLSGVGKKVQQMYANEAGCDPDFLNTLLSQMPPVAASANFVIADPVPPPAGPLTGHCTSNPGCRQFSMDQGGWTYLVTAGKISGVTNQASNKCPRDATIRLRTTIRGTFYSRRVTLINTCSYSSCDGGATSGTTWADINFEGTPADATANSTTACPTGTPVLPARRYGDIVCKDTSNCDTVPANTVSVHDLRWARRYLDTGAGKYGVTTYIAVANLAAPLTTTNGACDPATSTNQCNQVECVPAFDLDKDGANTEADLAIMEYYMRGYLNYLPVKPF